MEFIVTFLEGMASFISPCVLPMLPTYLSYFAGQEYKTKNKALINSIGFVLGFSIVFILLGVLASSFGMLINRYRLIIQVVFGIVIILFGLNIIEILKIPFLNKTLKPNYKKREFNFFTSLLFGIFFSIGWTPCVGAFLGSALMMASSKAHMVKGILLLISYSIGLGIPFIISSILIEKLKNLFTWIKEHYKIINTVSGIFLIIIGTVMIGQAVWEKLESNNKENISQVQINEQNENIIQNSSQEEQKEGGKIMNITSGNFEKEVLQSEVPVLVDFWASWCGPCKMMSPVVEEIAKEMEGKAKVCKVNIDEESELAVKYGVMSIPTFIVFENGKAKATTIGVKSKETLISLLK